MYCKQIGTETLTWSRIMYIHIVQVAHRMLSLSRENERQGFKERSENKILLEYSVFPSSRYANIYIRHFCLFSTHGFLPLVNSFFIYIPFSFICLYLSFYFTFTFPLFLHVFSPVTTAHTPPPPREGMMYFLIHCKST
jgi:hypothetical protein